VFPLLETAIGFVAIMLMVSLLVKSLTELIKDHFDFYCDNLYYEADQFLRSVVNKSLSELKTDTAVLTRAPWLQDFDLSRMGDEFFNEDNVKALLLSIEPDLDPRVLANIKGLLSAHVSRVKYMFQQRLKNLSFAVGVGLCLILDVNAVTIWRTLYTNDQVRTAFASESATSALLNQKTGEQNVSEQKAAELAEARAQFGERVKTFTSEVNFGVGRVWRQTPPMRSRVSWIYEFLGALMTGLLVSVGAPYWHDILESFGSLRKNANA
jgi:hypothetical protein